jgi:DNA-directed RNA polymerase specialized sigma24 family protein
MRAPAGLSPEQAKIFKYVFDDRRPHVEAYELIRQRDDPQLTFPDFLKQIAETYRAVERARGKAATHYFVGPPIVSNQTAATAEDALIAAESSERLSSVLEILAEDERLAVQLFVIDELSAERVARVVGWPNAKAVYNRVYRSLAVLRKELERRGVEAPRRLP